MKKLGVLTFIIIAILAQVTAYTPNIASSSPDIQSASIPCEQASLISLDTVNQLENILTLGKGKPTKLFWLSNDSLAIATPQGLWVHNGFEDTPELRISGSYWGNVALSSDGFMLAVAETIGTEGDSPSIKLWDVKTGNLITTLSDSGATLSQFAFSPDSKLLAAMGPTNIDLWDIETEVLIATISTELLDSLAFTPDSTQLIYSTFGGKVYVWNIATQSIQMQFETEIAYISSIKPIGDSVIIGGTNGTVGATEGAFRIFDLNTGEEIPFPQFDAEAIIEIDFDSNETLFAMATLNAVDIWNWDSSQKMAALDGSRSAVFSPDGSLLASDSREGVVKIWDINTYGQIASLPGYIWNIESFALSPDSTAVAFSVWNWDSFYEVGNDSEWRLWNLTTNQISVYQFPDQPPISELIYDFQGQFIAGGNVAGSILFFDDASGIQLSSVEAYSGRVDKLAFKPDGSMLASLGTDENISILKLWDISSPDLINRVYQWDYWVGDMEFLDNDLLAFSTGNGVIIWDINAQTSLVTVPPDAWLRDRSNDYSESIYSDPLGSNAKSISEIIDITLDTSGTYLLTSNAAAQTIWNLQPLKKLLEMEGSAEFAVFGRTNDSVILSGNSGISYRDIQKSSDFERGEIYDEPIKEMALSLDGTKLISLGHDSAVRVWCTQ